VEARRALLADVHTADSNLRLQVQWALGRVSDDPAAVDVLLDNMRNDPVPLFRDKAACALAYDQIHLAPARKLRLLEGLIGALDDPKLHQTNGYAPEGDEAGRRATVAACRHGPRHVRGLAGRAAQPARSRPRASLGRLPRERPPLGRAPGRPRRR
jgi:hypothetical protein